MIEGLGLTIIDLLKAGFVSREVNVSLMSPSLINDLSMPTLNLYLFSLVENRNLRRPAAEKMFADGKFVFTRPPLKLDCSYLVTAWSPDNGDKGILAEQKLISEALTRLYAFPEIAVTQFKPPLEQPCAIPTSVALPEKNRELEGLWRSLNITPKPAFIYTLTISLPIPLPERAPGLPVKERVFEFTNPGDSKQIFEKTETPVVDIAGRVIDSNTKSALEGVKIELELAKAPHELITSAKSNESGLFEFKDIPQTDYRLIFSKDGYMIKTQLVKVTKPISVQDFTIDLSEI